MLREHGRTPAIEAVQLAALAPGEVVVRIAGVGVCHTDLTAIDGHVPLPLPAVLGHEGSGVVQQVGPDVNHLAAGDHVVLSYDRCEHCQRCATGRFAYCENFGALNSSGARLDGSTTLLQEAGPVHGSFLGQSSMATHAIASERNAVKVDSDADLRLFGPLGCSMLTGAGAVFAELRPQPGESVAVFGCGAVGLAAVMAARSLDPSQLVAIEPRADRRALALALGADVALDPATDKLPRNVDVAIETVGTEAVIGAMLKLLASPGRGVTVGFHGPRNPITIDQGKLLFGRTLSGVIEGDSDPHELIPRLLALRSAGGFAFEQMITEYPFDELDRAITDTRSGDAVKAVLVPDA